MNIASYKGTWQLVWLALMLMFLGLATSAQTWTSANNTTSGKFIVERPTLLSLGFEWMIEGDANDNAAVKVEYRKTGESQWHQALPMLRLHQLPVPPRCARARRSR